MSFSKIYNFNSSSDFVFRAMPFLYPTGYAVVMNCWFSSWSIGSDHKEKELRFNYWFKSRVTKSNLEKDHPFLQEATFLSVGCCLIYHTDDLVDAEKVYNFFNDPDFYYVTFWENGIITNENT